MTNIVEVNYQQTGHSKSTNEFGMREMQSKAYEAKASQYLLLKAPPASGTSMLHTIMPNEYVIIDSCINRYVGDDLYVMNFAGNLLVKRLQFDPVLNSIDIISDNPQYTNYKLNMNEDQSHFHIIGRVVTTIRR